jgi:hypothetical protein
MDRDQWEKFVMDELTKLAPDRQAIKNWIERQGFKVDSAGDNPAGGWWLSAENSRMAFTKLTVRWDESKAPCLSVSVSWTAVEPHPVAILARDNPEAIVLDLVQPQVAGGQLVGLCGKARRDESGREGTLQHVG